MIFLRAVILTRKLYLPQPIVCTYVTLDLTLSLVVKFSPVAFLMFLCIWQYFFIDISILFCRVLKLQENKWQKLNQSQLELKLSFWSLRYSFCGIFKLLNQLGSSITSQNLNGEHYLALRRGWRSLLYKYTLYDYLLATFLLLILWSMKDSKFI